MSDEHDAETGETTEELPELTPENDSALRSYLRSSRRPRESMPFDTLRGYLFAVCGAPTAVPFEEWIVPVFGGESPDFEDDDEATKIITALTAYYNLSMDAINSDTPTPETVGADDVSPDGLREWSHGFSLGFGAMSPLWEDIFERLDPEDAEVLSATVAALGVWADQVTTLEELGVPEADRPETLKRLLEMFPDALVNYVVVGGAFYGMEEGDEESSDSPEGPPPDRGEDRSDQS